ncbi:hypothetical protein GCM10008983_10330 [Lentibacillus halophilus]|uniref:Uncharacterized protein n=1 Tax=Lentibacillus halophilus TaxID=295065 RepID=A0ABP3J061_9BACI
MYKNNSIKGQNATIRGSNLLGRRNHKLIDENQSHDMDDLIDNYGFISSLLISHER